MKMAYRLVALTLVTVASAAQSQQPAPAPQGGQAPRQGPPPQRGTPGRRTMAPTPGGPAMGAMGTSTGMMMGAPMAAGGGIASMLLAHSAELKLTDTQLSRLAAIARRTDDRHKAMRASMDSMMRANRPQPGATPTDRQPMMMGDQNRAMMDRMRDQERTDLRDALGVLTVDQQADAWMMRGTGPMGAGGPPRARLSTTRGRRAGE